MGLYGMLGESYTSLYIEYVRTSQDTHLWSSTTYYEDNFTF
jgi:hypothetical protein